jgi:hypothetical protein
MAVIAGRRLARAMRCNKGQRYLIWMGLGEERTLFARTIVDRYILYALKNNEDSCVLWLRHAILFGKNDLLMQYAGSKSCK